MGMSRNSGYEPLSESNPDPSVSYPTSDPEKSYTAPPPDYAAPGYSPGQFGTTQGTFVDLPNSPGQPQRPVVVITGIPNNYNPSAISSEAQAARRAYNSIALLLPFDIISTILVIGLLGISALFNCCTLAMLSNVIGNPNQYDSLRNGMTMIMIMASLHGADLILNLIFLAYWVQIGILVYDVIAVYVLYRAHKTYKE